MVFRLFPSMKISVMAVIGWLRVDWKILEVMLGLRARLRQVMVVVVVILGNYTMLFGASRTIILMVLASNIYSV